jgi:hypothetical protein
MQSIAQWQARHSPQYMIAMEKLQTQKQMAYELAERQNAQQWELAQYKENQATQRENERNRMALQAERERGKNRLAELDRELENKIRFLGAESQNAMAQKIFDEFSKNRDHFREGLAKRADFRADMQRAILTAMIAKKQGAENHSQALEKMRLEAELRHRKEEIDEYVKKAIAYGEAVAQKQGEKAGADAVNSLIAGWNLSG